MNQEELRVLSNSQLMAELDDVVQLLTKLNHEEWIFMNTETKSRFVALKREIYSRLQAL